MQNPPQNPSHEKAIWPLVAAVLTGAGLIYLLLLMLSLGLRHGMNHDECLPLAGGAVLAHQSLLPYRDYPYFHMPDLVLIYGLLFRWTSCILLPARIFSVVAGWLTILLLWFIVRRECREKPAFVRWLLPAAAALLTFSCPVFREAYWRTWNHALATLFGLAAVAYGLRPRNRGGWFWCGFFAGLATGTRLTFAPLFAPLAIAAALEPSGGNWRERIRRVAFFFGGAFISLLPSLILFAMAPRQFLYGNFTFNWTTNILLRQAQHHVANSIHARLLFPFTDLLPDHANLLLTLLFVILAVAGLVRFSSLPPDSRYRILLVLGLLPFVFLGAIAPQITQNEYYYPFVPALALSIAISAASFPSRAAWISTLLILGMAILTTAWSWPEYERLADLRRPAEWPALLFHDAGLEMRQSVPSGSVLTLEPIIPLEAGLPIYPSLVTGGIAWRAEPFVPPADRDPLMMMGPDNFPATLAHTPPSAILTTTLAKQQALEDTLIDWAKVHHFAPHPLEPRGKIVDPEIMWLPPPPAAR